MLRSKLSKCDSMVPVTLSVAVPFSVLSATQSINVLLTLSALEQSFPYIFMDSGHVFVSQTLH